LPSTSAGRARSSSWAGSVSCGSSSGYWLYAAPANQKRLGKTELDYIHSDADEQADDVKDALAKAADSAAGKAKAPWYVEWGKLLTFRQTWAFAFGKFMTDGVWWFFLFWLPAYLKAQYAMTGTQIAVPIAVLYTMTCVGSISGGWFPMFFINRGYEPYAGRMRAMFVIALFPLVVLLSQPLGGYSYWIPVLLIGIGASAHQAWSANLFTTVSDMFPKRAVASVTGIGGMFGGLGGILITKSGGWLFDAYRQAGIAKTWARPRLARWAPTSIRSAPFTCVNKHGSAIDLNKAELGSLPKEIVVQLQAINADAFAQLKHLQTRLVLSEMTTSYAIMFGVCALAYLVAWSVMKMLVPRFKKIETL
jgi:ACS family hexuronate transporter-like MFS transporter